MEVLQMHIAIDLELNKLNSNLYDNILPQEKDYFLNRAQERFIKQRYGAQSNNKGKGFEMSQKRIDDLKNLLVPNYYDKAYRVAETDFDYLNKLRFYLPNDYMFLTSQRSKVFGNDCGDINLQELTETIHYYILPLSGFTVNYNGFSIKTTSETPYIQNLNYTAEDKELFITKLIIDWETKISISKYKVYYERYNDIYSPGNLIFVAKETPQALKWYNAEVSTNFSPITKQYKYYTATCGKEEIVVNRFAQQDDVYKMQMDPFNDTAMYGPLTIINQQFIDVFIKRQNFIVKEISISYIRRPKLISLELNQSCELAEETHAEIVRDAVNLMLENFEAQNRLQTSLQVEQTNE
jgi:hypothetical protein